MSGRPPPLYRRASDRGRAGPSAAAAAPAARGRSWGGAGAGSPGDGQTADPPATGRLEVRPPTSGVAKGSESPGVGSWRARLVSPSTGTTSRPIGHHGQSSVTAAGAG